MKKKYLIPTHPGIILLKEFLEPLGISQYRLAKDIHVPARRIHAIVTGIRAISADTALRLSAFFGMSENFWINMQAHYDIACARAGLAGKLKKEVHPWKIVETTDA